MIVKAVLEDAKELNALVNGAYRGEGAQKGWASEADLFDGSRTDQKAIEEMLRAPGYLILKYVENEKITGCVELHCEGTKLYLGMLSVNPELQGSGIGKKLMHAAEEEARKQKCTCIYMTVITRRLELLAWYIRHGYVDTGIRKPFGKRDPRHGIPKVDIELATLEKTL
jgi:ribosomal protein S18 acetylase RimI-like enzyme